MNLLHTKEFEAFLRNKDNDHMYVRVHRTWRDGMCSVVGINGESSFITFKLSSDALTFAQKEVKKLIRKGYRQVAIPTPR